MVLTTALLVMLAAAATAPGLSRMMGRNAGFPLAGVFLGVGALLLTRAEEVLAGGAVLERRAWAPTFDVSFSLRMDGLALVFVILVLGVGALIMAYAPRYLAKGNHQRFYTILTLFAGAMLGLVLAGDLVLLLIFWEVTTVCSFLLIAGPGRTGARPAIRALVVTAGGGLALLGAVVILAGATGTTSIATVVRLAPAALGPVEEVAVITLIMVAAFTKSAQLPFHFWLPGAMVAITPVSAYLHAATMVKAGIYLLLRSYPMFADEVGWHVVLVSVGLATALFGAFVALRQNDLKALLAYSTVSQLGLIVALVGVGTTDSLGAAALLTAAHALFKATLFMLVGIIDRQAGSRDLRRISGLWRTMPVTAVLSGLAAMSLAGLPPLVGFVAKEELFHAFLGATEGGWMGDAVWPGRLGSLVAVAAAALTFAYGARIILGAFAGRTVQRRLREPSATFLVPAAIPAILGLVLGLTAWSLNPFVDRTLADTGVPVEQSDLTLWHGFTPALGMSALAIGLGTMLHLNRRRLHRFIGEEKPSVATALFDRAWDGLLRGGARVGGLTAGGSIGRHLLPAGAGVVGVVAVAGLSVAPDPPVPGGTRAEDWAVLAVLLAAVLALALARWTIGALVLVGVIGFTLMGWLLMLGAPDVAFTLLLVEILTVVVAVPVLRRMPERLLPVDARPRTLVSAGVAVVVGAALGTATWLLGGRREPSFAADHLLREGEAQTGGTNTVNTVLVDFRALDTLGEISVLLAAAVGLLALLGAPKGNDRGAVRFFGPGERAVLGVGSRRVVVPVLLLAAVVFFWRGHDLPGGGFIAGLMLGAAAAVARLAGSPLPVPGTPVLLATGLGLAAASGLIGLAAQGAVLGTVKAWVPFLGDVSSSLVFDAGVVLVVLALVEAALHRFEAAR